MTQYPPQGPWTGPHDPAYPAPAPPVGPGRGRLVALAAALAVLLAAGSAGITLAVRGHAGPAAQTSVVTSTTTTTSLTTLSSTSTAERTTVQTSTVTPRPSSARSMSSDPVVSTTSVGPEITCTNGVKASSNNCTSYECWDLSVVTTQRCPALTGEKALKWIFRPAAGQTAPTCTPLTDKTEYATGEIEVLQCEWSDLPALAVYTSRWKDVASARAYLTGNYGPSQPWTAKLNGKQETEGEQWNTTPTGKNQKINAELYDHQPYSLLAIIGDPDGAGKGQWDKYFQRQGLEYASLLDIVVASTT